MFPRLEKAFEDILAERDCPAVRRLCFDCWDVAVRSGEGEGLKSAAVLLSGVRAFQSHEQRIRQLGSALVPTAQPE